MCSCQMCYSEKCSSKKSWFVDYIDKRKKQKKLLLVFPKECDDENYSIKYNCNINTIHKRVATKLNVLRNVVLIKTYQWFWLIKIETKMTVKILFGPK